MLDKNSLARRKLLEKQIFILLFSIYCRDIHKKEEKAPLDTIVDNQEIKNWLFKNPRISKYELCRSCGETINKAMKHIDRCPHSLYKSFCHQCPTRCYSQKDIDKIIPIMKYSNKKIVKYHPILSIKFLISLIRAKLLLSYWKLMTKGRY